MVNRYRRAARRSGPLHRGCKHPAAEPKSAERLAKKTIHSGESAQDPREYGGDAEGTESKHDIAGISDKGYLVGCRIRRKICSIRQSIDLNICCGAATASHSVCPNEF